MGIHQVESGFGRSTLAGVHSGANFLGCCKGPFQFYDKPGEWSTWLAKSPVSGKTYARDGNGDGKADIYDNVDSMFAAGALLYASGAPGDWKGALFSYNRSTAYGEEVLSHARYYQAHVQPPSGGGGSQGAVVAASYSPDSAQPAADDGQGAECGAQPAEIVAPAEGGPYSPPMAAGSYTITTQFWAWRGSYNHQGTDLAAPEGTPFRAIGDGKVTIAGPYDPDGYGTYICIEHTMRLKSCYGHPSRIDVHVGETVKRGQVIGAVGAEGDSTGPHLHFEVWLDGSVVCSANYVGVSPKEWCTSDAPGYDADPGSGAQPA
jgi:murein DD-endopeptidase MepM/ murein hydrolase activator NlpD